MADILVDLKAYLVEQGISAKIIFRDTMPDAPDRAVALYEYQGTSPMAQIAGSTRSIQIVTRSTGSDDAKDLSRQIHKLLQTEDGEIHLTEDRWGMLHLRQTPFKMKTDESKRSYFVFNIGITTDNE